MRHSIEGRCRGQFQFLRRQFLQDGELPFANVLCHECIVPALEAIEFAWKDRIYTPLVTLWVFLIQVMSEDHSCRNAVARLIAHRASRGESLASLKNWCQALWRSGLGKVLHEIAVLME